MVNKNIREKNVKTEIDSIKKERKPLSKKLILGLICGAVAICVIVITLCLVFLVFNKKNDATFYFNNFTSTKVIDAKIKYNLGEDISIYSYDAASGIFITARKYMLGSTSYGYKYGLASEEQEYVLPIYDKIIQIKGDYAVVALSLPSTTEFESDVDKEYIIIDIIRFKGDDKAPYSIKGDKTIGVPDSSYCPVITDDYIVSYNTLDSKFVVPTFMTFYEYKNKNEALEKFRIRQAYDLASSVPYKIIQFDDYFAAYCNDYAFFYNTKSKIINGYLEYVNNGAYIAFPDLNSDALSEFVRELSIFYMGNGWFARTARLYRTNKIFDGFNIVIGRANFYQFSRTKTDFFNVRTGITKSELDIEYIDDVANEFRADYFTQQAYLMGSLKIYNDESDTYSYSLPFANPSTLIKKGYSIVYYYYKPYLELYPDDTETYRGYFGETAFYVYDENLNRVDLGTLLMPPLFIDGVGVMNSDLGFTEYTGNARCYDVNLSEKVLAPAVQGFETYKNFYGNKYANIIDRLQPKDDGYVEKYGAITPSGKRITDFDYDEMTYFSGGYCIAVKRDGADVKYYRIDEKGATEEMERPVYLGQGIYTYSEDGKVGVKNYAGEILVDATWDTVNLINVAMKDGKDFVSYGEFISNGRSTIIEFITDN